MENAIKYYSLPNNICSCRDKNGDFTRISRNYKNYYKRIKNGEKSIDILNDSGVLRTCCRIKFLSIPIEPMIDRASERFTNNIVSPVIKENTRDLLSLVEVPDFPSMTAN